MSTVKGLAEISVSGIWIRRRGGKVQLLAEVEGEWRLLAEEPYDDNFSHIVEPGGIVNALPDSVGEIKGE